MVLIKRISALEKCPNINSDALGGDCPYGQAGETILKESFCLFGIASAVEEFEEFFSNQSSLMRRFIPRRVGKSKIILWIIFSNLS